MKYQEYIRRLVSTDIYQLGQRSYLVGEVLHYEHMHLPSWRKYTVQGREQYIVTVPVIHLQTVDISVEDASQTLKELMKCNCPYFYEYGICKHCVAVCFALDKEYFASQESTQKNVLDRFENNDSQLKDVIEEYFTSTSALPLNILIESLKHLFTHSKNPELQLNKILTQYSRTSNIDKIIKLSLSMRLWGIGGTVWWNVFLPLIHNGDKAHRVLFWSDFWPHYSYNQALLSESRDQLHKYAKKLSKEEKQAITDALASHSGGVTHAIEFALFSCYYDFIETVLPELDFTQLLHVAPEVPYLEQEIDTLLHYQMDQRLEYADLGDGASIVPLLTAWRKLYPDSEKVQSTIESIQKRFPRRKKLLEQLKNL